MLEICKQFGLHVEYPLNEYTDQEAQSSCASAVIINMLLIALGLTASGGMDCVNCPNGKDNSDGGVCEDCDAGRYANNSGLHVKIVRQDNLLK